MFLGKKANIFEANADGAPKREVGRITVTHTERQFPTPERESVKPQEDEVCVVENYNTANHLLFAQSFFLNFRLSLFSRCFKFGLA